MSGARFMLRLVVALGALLASCSQAPPGASESDDPTTRRLERARDAYPRSSEARAALASEYYRVARRAIDAGDEAQYRTQLRKAQAELIAALRIDRFDSEPHTQMGIILAYQGDLDSAYKSFSDALRAERRRIRPGARIDGGLYTNLAHIDVYRGRLEDARRHLRMGRAQLAPRSEIARIETLLAWRAGDRAEARRIFEAARTTPGFVDTWDSAPLPQPLASFEDFCAACCRNPSCGPFLLDACTAEGQEVQQRQVTRETLVEEMRLERERQAKLKEIYARERGLSIEVEPDAPEPAP